MLQVMSVLPFSAKNAFVTAYLLESSLAWFKDVVCCFQTIFVSLFLFIYSPMKENKKFTNVFTRNICQLAAVKNRAYLPLYVFEKTRVSCNKLCEKNKSGTI